MTPGPRTRRADVKYGARAAEAGAAASSAAAAAASSVRARAAAIAGEDVSSLPESESNPRLIRGVALKEEKTKAALRERSELHPFFKSK
jgi:hypothetical protein